jgi:hypothetical protein
MHHFDAEAEAVPFKKKQNLYYWFSVDEVTLPLHHLIAQNTPDQTHYNLCHR